MTLKNILVHLDTSPRTAERLALAVKLAARDGARLVGVFAQRFGAHRVGVVATWPPDEYAAAAGACAEQFKAATKGLAQAEWIDINRGGDQQILQIVTDLARHFDLIICGQTEEGDARKVPTDLVDQIIMESGRPVLVLPYAGHYTEFGRRPLIAWNDSRSAARALNDALPLLSKDCEATLISFTQPHAQPSTTVGQIVKHLGCHGIHAKEDTLVVQDIGVMDMLLNRASDHGSDLLVAGAFGNYGFPVLNRGGGTRFLLQHMTLPVLFSH